MVVEPSACLISYTIVVASLSRFAFADHESLDVTPTGLGISIFAAACVKSTSRGVHGRLKFGFRAGPGPRGGGRRELLRFHDLAVAVRVLHDLDNL